MGMGYGKGQYYGTRGSIKETYFAVSTKSEAKLLLPLLPESVRQSAKDFINRGSNRYDSFTVAKDTSGNIVLIKENPGKITGSRAIYFLIVDKNGNRISSYKETYDPAGNLVHSKEK
jgi:hypothetical protein